MTLPTLTLQTPGWTLRAWRDTDAPTLARHANNPAVWRHMSDAFPHPYTLEIAQHWVRRGHVDFGGDNWAICHGDDAWGGCGLHLGSGALACNAEIGYWLAQAQWGQGVATQVAHCLTERAFGNTHISRVFAPVHADNPASVRVLEHNGFMREGLQRVSAMKAGAPIDLIMMARYRPGVGCSVDGSIDGSVDGSGPALPTLPT